MDATLAGSLAVVACGSCLFGYLLRSMCGPVLGHTVEPAPPAPPDVELLGDVAYIDDDDAREAASGSSAEELTRFVDDESADIAAALQFAYEKRARDMAAAAAAPAAAPHASLSSFFANRGEHTKRL